MCRAICWRYVLGRDKARRSRLLQHAEGFSEHSVSQFEDEEDPVHRNEGSTDEECCQKGPGYNAVVSQEDVEEEIKYCVNGRKVKGEREVLSERHVRSV